MEADAPRQRTEGSVASGRAGAESRVSAPAALPPPLARFGPGGDFTHDYPEQYHGNPPGAGDALTGVPVPATTEGAACTWSAPTGGSPVPLRLSRTAFALVMKALRVERGLSPASLAVRADLPVSVILELEVSGPRAAPAVHYGHTPKAPNAVEEATAIAVKWILDALHSSAPLTQEQVEIYCDLAGLDLARSLPAGGPA